MPIAEAPQTNRMHAVPQNIMDVEFKLIGDLTLRQFLYLFVFGGSAYVSTVVLVGIFKWPTVIFFAMLGVGLAFVPIQERGLDEWIANFVRSVYSPTQRIWRREPSIPSAFMSENLAVVKQELITLAPTSSRRKLEEYLEYKLSDDVVDPLDIPEKQYMMKVRDAYADYVPAAQPTTQVGVGLLEPEPVQEPEQFVPQEFESETPEAPETSKTPETSEVPATQSTPEVSVAPITSEPAKTDSVPAKLTEAPKMEDKKPEVAGATPQPQAQQASSPQVIGPKEESKPVVVKPVVQQSQPVQQQKPQPEQTQHRHKHIQHTRQTVPLSPMTPDRHSGRRFINLVPTSGELILPIRGERVIKTSQQEEFEEDIKVKAEKLQQLLSQIKRESTVAQSPSPVSPVVTATPTVQAPTPEQSKQLDEEAQTLANKLKGEQERLSTEITKLETEKSTTKSETEATEKDNLIKRLKTEQERTQADYEALQRQLVDLQNKLKSQDSTIAASSPVPQGPAGNIQTGGKANIVQGSIRTKTGATLEGVLLIVKNQKGEAVRAVKTDSLGHFKLTTPLANGVYTIQVTGDNLGSTFDIISVEVKGEPIPVIEFFGR